MPKKDADGNWTSARTCIDPQAINSIIMDIHFHIPGRHFTLFTDHKAISYLFTAKHSLFMLNHWAFLLLQFDFNIVHWPGVQMVLEDVLSYLYLPNFWEENGLAPLVVPNDIKTLAPVKKQRNVPRVPSLSVLDASEHSPIALLRELVHYIKLFLDKTAPSSMEEQQELFSHLHLAGHKGAANLFNKVWNEGFFWPSLQADCFDTTHSCDACLCFNVAKHGFHPLKTISATFPFEHVALDLFGPLTTNESGFCFVLVVTNIATRFTFLHPLVNWTAAATTSAFYRVICDFGFPKIVQTDNGSEFVNETMANIKAISGFDHRFIAAYHL